MTKYLRDDEKERYSAWNYLKTYAWAFFITFGVLVILYVVGMVK